MPICLPELSKNELVYSVIARYADRVNYRKKNGVIRDLFGMTTNDRVLATDDLPGKLGAVAAAYPQGSRYTLDYLIDNHTLLPYFAPLQPSEQVQKMRLMMVGNVAGLTQKLRVHAVLRTSTLRLQFCRKCVEVDRREVGEAYWHREHQLHGALVCPHHGEILAKSSIPLRNPGGTRYYSVERVIQLDDGVTPQISAAEHECYWAIVRDMYWLLTRCDIALDLNTLHDQYLVKLKERDLATLRGQIRLTALKRALEDFYSPELLAKLDCGWTVQESGDWVRGLSRLSKGHRYPLHHILLIQFLGYTLEEFCSRLDHYQPFGEPNWPCLNPVADHYRELVIGEQNLELSHSKKRQVAGTFSCTCGFVYVRAGHDQSAEDRYRFSYLEEHGEVWENVFRSLWSDSTMSIAAIARRLGVRPGYLRRHASRLQLFEIISMAPASKHPDSTCSKADRTKVISQKF